MIDLMMLKLDCILVAIGVWILCDGVFSLNVYLNAPAQWRQDNPDGKQTWFRDHWIRVLRCICGIALMWLGMLI